MKQKMHRFYQSISMLLLISLLAALFQPIPAYGLMLELEESADPPASLEKPQEAPLEAVGIAVPRPGSSGSEPAADSAPGAGAQTPKVEKSKYHGLFRVWEPLDKALPLTNGSVDLIMLNLRNMQQWQTAMSRTNGVGNMYFEAGRSYGAFKNFNVKYQSGKQLKNNPTTNEYLDMSANLFGLNMSFARKAQLSSGSGSSSSTLSHNWAMSYAFNNGLSLGFASDEARSSSSSAPQGTVNNKQTWTMGWQGSKYWVKILNINTASRAHATGSVSKTTQTQMQIGVPVSDLLALELKFDLNANSNATPGSAGTEDDKLARTLSVRYKASDRMNLSYTHDRTANSSESTEASTAFNIISNQYQMDYSLSKRLKFKSKSLITENESAGRSTDHTNSLSMDHRTMSLLPGTTSITMNRKFSNPGSEDRTTKTTSITTPLNYFNNRLGLNLSRTTNNSLTLSAGAASETENTAQNVAATIRITPGLSLNSSVNRTRNASLTDGAMQSHNTNITSTDNVTYAIRFPLTRRFSSLKQCNYSFGKTVNRAQAFLPAESLTTTQSLTQSGAFQFQAATWNGQYVYTTGRAIQNHADSSKTTRHQFIWSFNDLFGYKVTANYSTNQQITGAASNGIFKATRAIDDKSTLELNYEFSKNQDTATANNNTYNRFFQLMMKHSF